MPIDFGKLLEERRRKAAVRDTVRYGLLVVLMSLTLFAVFAWLQ